MGTLVLFLLFINIGVPIFVAWLTIKYVFKLRKEQNEQFIADLVRALRDKSD